MLSLSDEINRGLTALWRDRELVQAISGKQKGFLNQRVSDPPSSMAPRVAHETRDDLLREGSAAARALGAPPPLPEYHIEPSPDKPLKVFQQTYQRGLRTLDALGPMRARVAWRILREHARLKSLVHEEESLLEALGLDSEIPEDPWRYPSISNLPTSRDGKTRLTMPAWQALNSLQNLPLLPPAVPVEFRDRDGDFTILNSYSPHLDHDYLGWLEGCQLIADYLGIIDGSPNDREQGKLGLEGLLDADRARLLWPSRYEVAGFEGVVIEETLGKLIEGGAPAAVQWLGDEYGLTRREAYSMIKLAKAQAREVMDADVEDSRAVLTLRLEDYIKRAKDGLDLRSEMHALKLMALVQGLGKTKPEDAMQDFIDIVAKVSARRDAKELLPGDEKPQIEALREV